jgi:predicted enzyme related to lactoylglutathione lyase
MSIQVKEIAFVAHAVADVPRARSFYEGWLGLKPATQAEIRPGIWWIEYEIAGVALGITNVAPDTWGRSSAVTLEVTDLDEALADARRNGITVTEEIMEFPYCRIFSVKDPDGNEVSLHQRKR